MKSFPFDSHVTYKSDGTPVFDRAVDSAVYRGLLKNLFTTGILSTDSTNMQVTTNEDMTVNVLSGFAMVEGVMNLNDETVTLEVEAADTNYARIDSVVLRLNTNDDFRNCDFYIVKGTPSEAPVRPALTREIAVYELGLADIYVASGATSITADNITDTRYEEERCGVMTSGDISRYIDAIQSTIDEIVASLTSENDKRFKFGYSSDLDKYGCKVDDNFLPFGGTKIILDGEEVMTNINMILSYTWNAAFTNTGTHSKGVFSALDVNDNIHVMGDTANNSSYYNMHYQYGSGTWSKLSDMPVGFAGGCALTDADGNVTVFIPYYVSGGRYPIRQYRYVNGAWVDKGSTPGNDYVQNSTSEIYAAIKDGNIHVIFFNIEAYKESHFVYNTDNSWSDIGTAPGVGPIVVDKNGNIHMFVYDDGDGKKVTHYVYKDSSWSIIDVSSGEAVSFAFLDSSGAINIFRKNSHYKYVSGKRKLVGEIKDVEPSNAFVVDGTLTAVGVSSSNREIRLYEASGSFIQA